MIEVHSMHQKATLAGFLLLMEYTDQCGTIIEQAPQLMNTAVCLCNYIPKEISKFPSLLHFFTSLRGTGRIKAESSPWMSLQFTTEPETSICDLLKGLSAVL